MVDIVAGGLLAAGNEIDESPIIVSSAKLSSGGFVLISELSSVGTFDATVYDSTGQQVGQPHQFPVNGYAPDVVGLSNGNFAVVWTEMSSTPKIMSQIFDSDGMSVTSSGIVSQGANIFAPSLGGTSVSALPNGDFVVSWLQSNPVTSAFAAVQVVDGGGTPLNPAATIHAGTLPIASSETITLADGRTLIDYSYYSSSIGGPSGITIAVYDPSSGTIANPTFATVAETANFRVLHSDITQLASGKILLTWSDYLASSNQYGFHGELFDTTGASLSHDFSITLPSGAVGGRVDAVTALPNGGFAVAYESGTTSDLAIVGQIYDDNATAVGPSFVISNPTETTPYTPQLVSFGSDDLAATWNYASSGANDASMRIYHPVISGTSAGETINGTSGIDVLNGLGGDDTLNGLAGDDIVIGGAGADTLHGGDGIDTADYSGSPSAVMINLVMGVGTGGDAEGDQLDGIENLIGSAFADALHGDAGSNRLDGGDGNDFLEGGAGADVLIGGNGFDIADYSNSDSGVTVNLATGLGSGGDAEGDVLQGIEQVNGSAFADILIGDGAANVLNGMGGDDLLIGGVNADTLDGGTGTDTVSYESSANAVHVNLATGTGQLGDAQNDTYISIENVRGSAGDDTLTGDANANRLEGLAGNDILTGGLGADTLVGGAGNDIFRDTAAGLNGDTIADFSIGDAIHITDAQIAGFHFSLDGHTLTYTGGALTLTNVPAGHLYASASASSGMYILIQPPAIQNDFSGDGKSDILWHSNSGQVGDWLATGSGSFAPNPTLYGVTTDWKIVGTGDFNGDGKADILWRNDNGQIGDWLGSSSGNGTFTPNSRLYGATADWHIAGTGDFNGDGNAHLLWRNDDGRVGTWAGDNGGNFTANSMLYGVTNDWKIAGTGDFDGDGKADILWRNTNTGQFGDWLSNGNGAFTPNATLGNSPLNWHIAETGDFNGDGKTDILWRADDGQVGTWFAGAGGNFTPNATLYGVTTDWKIVDVGDYNGDGKDDILWRNGNSGQFGDWLSNGNGSFTPNATLYGSPLDWNVAGDHTFLV